jgi:DnaA family protein
VAAGSSPDQLVLRLSSRSAASFANFVADGNREAAAAVARPSEPGVYLWGGRGSGRTHLLQAAARAVGESGGRAGYLDLADVGLDVAVLEGLEGLDLVCLDNLDAIAGARSWETPLFHLYNRLRARGIPLRLAAGAAPAALGLALPDLASRLGWALVYHLQPLDDAGKLRALTLRAAERGLTLGEEVGRYLIRRGPRDSHRLFAALERLDQASLAHQRRLTIPFVRETLGLDAGASPSARPEASGR